ncbi:hypothetical protein BKG82_27190 [Mycobacteroides chelonae]|uniref:Uncharacterized protein n=1 Tax=Mycobacteroides chelonae TaxID=1774 RepID=A0A1S1LHS0_MYCCH|nr:DUF6166 domain-containing protein [Mycobacteroides chelonae]OHU47339.1 hypothetical protein BKG82_27190 [Mycobacteroides chelonae]
MGSNTVIYRGYGNQKSSGGRLVVVDVNGDLSPLPHQSKHSPTGMSWGYSGSGPADLARSLLIHALGDRARCATCAGSGEVVYDTVARLDIPVASRSPDADPGRYSEVLGCNECEEGCAVSRACYQRFKHDVIAGLSESGWSLTQNQILQWVDEYPSS